jgi:hypothetical protein
VARLQQRVPLHAAVPVQSGEFVQVRFQVPAGMYASLFLVNGRGELQLVQDFPAQKAAHKVVYPAGGRGRKLEGPPGTEVVFVCGQVGAPVTEKDVRSLWAGGAGLPALQPVRRVLRLRPEEVVDEGEKPRDLGEEGAFPDQEPVRERLENFRQRLRARGIVPDGVAFRHE